MKDIYKTAIAKDWILKLANGINPLDGSTIPDGDLVNNVHISRCLFYVSELLSTTKKKSSKKSKKYELEFCVSPEELSKVNIVNRTCITNFVREINGILPENMEPMPYAKIVNWLMVNGYLEEVEIDNLGKRKTPTATGRRIGISAAMKEGTKGPYWAIEYNANAQRFILDNIYAITEA